MFNRVHALYRVVIAVEIDKQYYSSAIYEGNSWDIAGKMFDAFVPFSGHAKIEWSQVFWDMYGNHAGTELIKTRTSPRDHVLRTPSHHP
jgi:hypothetical protein